MCGALKSGCRNESHGQRVRRNRRRERRYSCGMHAPAAHADTAADRRLNVTWKGQATTPFRNGQLETGYAPVVRSIIVHMGGRLSLVIAVIALTTSCTRHAQTERLMMWSEEAKIAGTDLPRGEKIIVLRFVEDPAQGLIEDWNSGLPDRLTRLGNPVRVTFDCWRQVGGTFGFNIVAIGGEPYAAGATAGPSRAGAFSEGPSRPNPLESVFQR